MFTSKLIFILATIYSIAILVKKSNADSEGNIHLFKNEISKAMENCGETKEVRDEVKEEYAQRVSNPSVHGRYRRESRGFGTNNEDKTLRDSESGDWDDDENTRIIEKSWNDPKDDKFIIDSIYSHDRRNDFYGNKNFSYSNKSEQNQNTTKPGQGYFENNFDSRGGHVLPGLEILNDNRKSMSVRRLDLIKNPFIEVKSNFIRNKRHSALIKSASDSEVNFIVCVQIFFIKML